uniref:Cytochrome P450 4c3 n=1 Tax=Scolopendra viridis TaxID=118503 RepID=A0A4D5R9T3_SCOVI
MWMSTVILGVIGLILYPLIKHLYVRWRVLQLPGPRGLPIVGHLFDFVFLESHEYLPKIAKIWKEYEKQGLFLLYGFNQRFIYLCKPEFVQVLLSNNEQIKKAGDYDVVRQWLGDGLFLSSGTKWHSRRKLLTPSFHFRNLDENIDVINEQSKILVEQLSEKIGKEAFPVYPYISRCTLDVICETAMGCRLETQLNRDSEYLAAVDRMCRILYYRSARIWLSYDWLFKLTSVGRESKKCLEILHGFTDKVIQERKLERKTMSQPVSKPEDSITGRKKRLAFLDLLLEASDNGRVLSDEDLREEVDTFMFAGHDTTGTGITWALYLLGHHPEIQEKILKELDEVFGDDEDFNVSSKDLPRLKYLEQVIKETHRIYPPAPDFARNLTKDMKFGDYTAPAGSSILVMPFFMHRNEEMFPDPEKFDPDRFLSEEVQKRHPFAYTPFSAGPRNCIGQKFALIEEKIILSHLIRSYEITSVEPRDQMKMLIEMVLRPKSGILLRLKPRTK